MRMEDAARLGARIIRGFEDLGAYHWGASANDRMNAMPALSHARRLNELPFSMARSPFPCMA